MCSQNHKHVRFVGVAVAVKCILNCCCGYWIHLDCNCSGFLQVLANTVNGTTYVGARARTTGASPILSAGLRVLGCIISCEVSRLVFGKHRFWICSSIMVHEVGSWCHPVFNHLYITLCGDYHDFGFREIEMWSLLFCSMKLYIELA